MVAIGGDICYTPCVSWKVGGIIVMPATGGANGLETCPNRLVDVMVDGKDWVNLQLCNWCTRCDSSRLCGRCVKQCHLWLLILRLGRLYQLYGQWRWQ